jgi:hypothetical protein
MGGLGGCDDFFSESHVDGLKCVSSALVEDTNKVDDGVCAVE